MNWALVYASWRLVIPVLVGVWLLLRWARRRARSR